MKVVEFQAQLNSNQTLTVPLSVIDSIPVGQTLRVFILVPEGNADADWEQLTAEEFGQGYANSDAIYDKLPGR
jgi:hypothetical protein